MIELYIEPYCHSCPNFEAETVKTYYTTDLGKPLPSVQCARVICIHRKVCADLYDILKGDENK